MNCEGRTMRDRYAPSDANCESTFFEVARRVVRQVAFRELPWLGVRPMFTCNLSRRLPGWSRCSCVCPCSPSGAMCMRRFPIM